MRKIMFNEYYGLQAAVLSGMKDMTRRLAQSQYYAESQRLTVPVRRIFFEDGVAKFEHHRGTDVIPSRLQPYKVGTVLAVAQRYSDDEVWRPCVYDGDGEEMRGSHAIYSAMQHSRGWNNKMFVRAELMPHRVRITDRKAELLQDISNEDCLREGIVRIDGVPRLAEWRPYYTFARASYAGKTPRAAFAELIDCLSGRGMWNLNPWVFAYTMELVQ